MNEMIEFGYSLRDCNAKELGWFPANHSLAAHQEYDMHSQIIGVTLNLLIAAYDPKTDTVYDRQWVIVRRNEIPAGYDAGTASNLGLIKEKGA